MSIELQCVGQLRDGSDLIAARAELNGLQFTVLSLGASLQDLRLVGHDQALVLGYKDPLQYEDNPAYLGSMVGRCANRIAYGACELNGQQLQLTRSEGHEHHLHGGPDGSSQRNWQMSVEQDRLVLVDCLPDGHMGYPGNLQVKVTYSVPDEGCLRVEIEAQADADTLCNFTPHWYFNLAEQQLDKLSLQVFADTYLATENGGIPLPEPQPVADSLYDLRVGANLSAERLAALDHNYCLAEQRRALTPIARLASENVQVDISSTEAGVQVYGGQYLAIAAEDSLSGLAYGAGSGVAIEPQCWPNGPNNQRFPDTSLLVGESYRQVSEYRFVRLAV